ncbi:MAG: Na+/H+ antiporter NhaC family protein [Bacillota bacterium]|uniref:Na+/H+ antiporter NhaC family protein n=1 Tax=unclassified Virgibacillus TaxID=2620237 RepID=UPI000EF4BDEC|nr:MULTISPECIES: Na+/H+ antiporter NhaC family protein [unclassified Virgibacillus]MCC2249492.1 Na+/H+ antiporter NhaC family protein [Virgibacillus sp. AGTR]MDY7043310.1 Na+/H+ antiporter NhaC family protein [Virgibacillus sp. M23]QRZ17857.1 Na+/H+ antiporter NhaC family protein [Virgibacillus sp. AGTR]
MEGTIFSLIPAILMLVLVLVTRNVLLSLGTGIVAGALLIHDFSIWDSLKEIGIIIYTIFISEGSLNTGNLLLLGFLLLLGIMTAFLQASGGSRAFGEWMIKRVKTRVGAQAMSAVLGIIIFIDDYFNSLAVGQIARPLTDRHKISRAKLAYIIDSTSAPVTVISPISSWGAYIIGIIGGLFVANGITDIGPLEAFIKMIPYNLYALGAILLVFLVAYLKMDIGPMKAHEQRAIQTGELLNPKQDRVPGDLTDTFAAHTDGKIYHLLVPIGVLILATVVSMLVTGANASDGNVSIISIFANTNVNLSLFIGGTIAVLTSFVFHGLQRKPKSNAGKIIVEGLKTMLPAIYILLLAWTIGSVIGTLKTGEYLAQIVDNASISPAWLPLLFFLIAGFMALATGTSWGTFGIMLPIAAEVTVITDISMLLPSMAAVLAGSVFGDHCTPISDTTILSSTGAGANHIDHVLTQLPYAILAAVSAGIGYLIIGFTNQVVFPLIATLVIVLAIALILHFLSNTKS